MIYWGAALILAAGGFAVVLWQLRRRGLHRWLGSYVLQVPRRRRRRDGQPVHLLLCIADHFEPQVGNAPREIAHSRVERWLRDYPQVFGAFRDSDGRPPRHTFFFPIDEYESAHVDALAELCRAGYGEVEIHLHHDQDTAAGLRDKLEAFKDIFQRRHGLLCRRRDSGELAYGFIHGNWALCNSRPDGRWCGVNNELEVLRQTGCYADFTLPSAPSPTQTRKINSIYYARSDPRRPRGHDRGQDAGNGAIPEQALLLIQGPLVLDWSRRKWGVIPRVENGCLQANQPPSMDRLENWLKVRVQIRNRPDWWFVKLHTHGALEANQAMLLGQPMIGFHQQLAQRARDDVHFHFHYVTAREMANLVHAAEAGWQGTVEGARDFQLIWDARKSADTEATSGAEPKNGTEPVRPQLQLR
jgi:hypothetical protein